MYIVAWLVLGILTPALYCASAVVAAKYITNGEE